MPTNQNKQDSLRFLVLSWELYPLFLGGLGVLALSVCKELIDQGHSVEVITPHDTTGFEFDLKVISLSKDVKKYLRTKQTVPGLEKELIYKPKKDKKKESWPPLFSLLNIKKQKHTFRRDLYPKNLLSYTRAFALAFAQWYKGRESEYDLVLAMDWHAMATMFAVSDEQSKKIIPYVNSTLIDRDPNPSKRIKEIFSIEYKGFQKAEKIITISNAERDTIVDNYDVKTDKIIVVNNDDNFRPNIDYYSELYSYKNVIYIGRIFPQKGLEFLVETAAKVVHTDPGVRFIIAGDGDLTPKIMKMVAELELERNIIFTGWINMEEKKRLYRSGDIFVMPSPSEPFGLTALEAIRSGVPVIASEKCGFTGVVPSTPTFAYYDIGNFANKLVFYLHNTDEAKALLKRQQEDLAKHSWSREIDKIITFTKQNLN